MAMKELEEYNEYLEQHIGGVKKAFNWLIDNDILSVDDVTAAKAYKNINGHDGTKYSQEEYVQYAKYFYGEQTEDVVKNFNYSWLHHIHTNPHHWQHWVLINDDDGTVALDMPKEYIIEMICDWWAFSWKSGNLYEIFDWYDKHKDKIMISDKSSEIVDTLLQSIHNKLDELNI